MTHGRRFGAPVDGLNRCTPSFKVARPSLRIRPAAAGRAAGTLRGEWNEMHARRCKTFHVTRPDAIAARRHGVVTLDDLAAAGIGRTALSHRIAEGRLRRLHRGVYLLGPLHGTWTREVAAVLAVGDGAALSHHSAAAFWGVRPANEGDVDVLVAGRKARHRAGIRIHRTTALEPHDVWWREGIAITSPARTLRDLARHLPRRELERAAEQAQVLRLVTRAGLGALARDDPAMTRSEAEARFLALVREAGLPEPETNACVAGYEVDFLWRDQPLVIEVDGFAFHSTREAFERDRRKDADLLTLGLRTQRATYRRIADEPAALVSSIQAQFMNKQLYASIAI